MKNEEFENIRARTICKANSTKNSRKTAVPKPNFVVVKTGNCKPKTGNKNNKTGPEGFEHSTCGSLLNGAPFNKSPSLYHFRKRSVLKQVTRHFKLSYGPI